MSTDVIALWHKRARPEPTDRDFNIQLGCHMEEFAEMLDEIESDDPNTFNALCVLRLLVSRMADQLKSGASDVYIENDVGFLDSLADQVVTAIGVGHCAGMDMVGAVDEVNRSNWSKFDKLGQPILDSNGKIKKGPRYVPPHLDECV